MTQWQSWQEFWDMGGRGPYVWGSLASVALAIALDAWASASRHRRAIAAIHMRMQEPS